MEPLPSNTLQLWLRRMEGLLRAGPLPRADGPGPLGVPAAAARAVWGYASIWRRLIKTGCLLNWREPPLILWACFVESNRCSIWQALTQLAP